LAEEYRPYLKAVVGRVLGGRLAGKEGDSDVVQGGLQKAACCLPQFRGHTPAEQRAWLAAIVRNHARNRLRFWMQEERIIDRERPLPAGSRDGPPLATGSSTPSERASRREQTARLMAVVEQLPPDHRQVILLKHFEELTHDEVARRMGLTRDVVRELWGRALRLLRVRLGDQS
jgi:RNA polymerase sigma-70 factor (ECF subfamily)